MVKSRVGLAFQALEGLAWGRDCRRSIVVIVVSATEVGCVDSDGGSRVRLVMTDGDHVTYAVVVVRLVTQVDSDEDGGGKGGLLWCRAVNWRRGPCVHGLEGRTLGKARHRANVVEVVRPAVENGFGGGDNGGGAARS